MISPQGEKRFLPGGKVRGNFFTIGNFENSKEIFFAEGYATGASIHEATNQCVIVAFSAGNLCPIASQIQRKHPHKKLVLCADIGKAGDESKRKWEEFKLGEVFFPDFQGKGKESDKDFNDLACHEAFGLEEIKRQVHNQLPITNMEDIFKIEQEITWIVPNLFIRGGVKSHLRTSWMWKKRILPFFSICRGPTDCDLVSISQKNAVSCTSMGSSR